MHAHAAACENDEITTTSAENASKVGGTPLTPNNNGKETASENVESGAGGKEEPKYDVVVDLLGGQ